jgi:hypothetical protein
VCPLHELKNQIPNHFGSGILLQIGYSYFLATVSHNLEDLNSLFIPTPPNIYQPLVGKTIRTIGASSVYHDDKIDIAVIKLNKKLVNQISSHYAFLDGQHIEIGHNIAEKMAYIMIGYPKGKTKRNPKEKITKCNPFTYHTTPKSQQSFKDLGYNPLHHILVEYDINNLNTQKGSGKMSGPKPRGMSGGALFHVPFKGIESHYPKIMFYLVGILRYFHLNDKKVIVATRIDFLTELTKVKINSYQDSCYYYIAESFLKFCNLCRYIYKQVE